MHGETPWGLTALLGAFSRVELPEKRQVRFSESDIANSAAIISNYINFNKSLDTSIRPCIHVYQINQLNKYRHKKGGTTQSN